MFAKFFRIFLVLATLLVMGGVVWYFMAVQPSPETTLLPAGKNAQSIAEIASNYYGELTRDVFPSNSLYLPWYVQAFISLGIIVVMVLITTFMPRARRLVMFITALTVSRHLLWRGLETLDMSSPISTAVGVLIYSAEVLAFFTMLLGYFQIWGQTEREPVNINGFPPSQLPSVDVFVCTYNEPLSVLYRSLVGCASMDYPNKKVYLLDDGNRPEMADLARKLGVNYITREQNIHAKAGNLNNAMQQTNGDLILVFDADHVPCMTFLKEVVGFFTQPDLAFVQTPQHFFTQDPFQRNLIAGEVTNNEQDLFFHVIQPGNDYWGATFFAGSGAIFRRSALQQIGGFATETITEDVHTGLRLHARGWKSLYYNRDLSAGMAQDSFADFIKQRLRWGRGMTQILFYDNPLFVRGLSFPQRICYFAGIWYFFHGFPRMIFLVAPLFFLLLGLKTINSGFMEILVYYLPSFFALFIGYTVVSRGIRHSFWSEVYETAQCMYLMMTTVATVLSPGKAKFRVTPKGTMTDRLNFNWQIVMPQLLIAGLIFVGLMMGMMRAIYTPEYWGGIFTNLFWSSYNLVLLLGAIYVALERHQLRISPRIFKKIRSELRLLDGTIAVGNTTNISESGVAIVFDTAIPITGTVALKLLDWDINESTVLSVQAVRSSVDRYGRHYVGFRIVNRTELQHQKLVRHMFGTAEVWSEYHNYTRPAQSFLGLMLTPIRLAGTVEKESKRRAERIRSTLSCMVEIEGRHVIGYSDEISETGISLYLKDERSVQKGQTLRLKIQWDNEHISDLNAQVVRMENTGGGQLKLGLNFVNLSREQRLEVIRQVYKPWEGLVRIAPAVNKLVRCVLRLENGQQIPGVSQEISEMAIVVQPQGRVQLRPEEKLSVLLYWDDETVSTYRGIYIDSLENNGANAPSLVIYFDHLDIKTLDALSQKLHEPIESKAFHTLNAV